MKENLIKYLKQFIIHNYWEDYKEQIRAIFTTICIIGNIEADTVECDDLLFALYDTADMLSMGIDCTEFTAYMIELII